MWWWTRSAIWWRPWVTSTDEQDRAQVEQLAATVQAVTGETVELALVDQGYTG
jgi:hypothetical protein